jgi:hypothetical protein
MNFEFMPVNQQNKIASGERASEQHVSKFTRNVLKNA